MTKKATVFLLIGFSLISQVFWGCAKRDAALVREKDLSAGWMFLFNGDNGDTWYPARVPGTIHTDLQHNGLIPDPFYGCNELDLQWVGQRDWSYRNTFRLDEQLLSNENISLVFEGLDTYATVYLNGVKLLEANNMFRSWEVSCRELLRKGENLLEITFASAENRFLEDSVALGYPLPGGRWVFARKAAYHFGWDWGPAFITAGIYKPVYLRMWNHHKPEDIQLYTLEISDEEAVIRAELEITSLVPDHAFVKVRDLQTGRLYAYEEIELITGRGLYDFIFTISEPVLWWSHDIGEPHLYDLNIEVETFSGYSYEKHISYGIRTIDVITEADEYGESFYLKLNGMPLFMKGANYIPQHSFVTEVTDADYERIIQNAVKSNMNMLRVWGGGIYERDIFYELCNRYGILVWQDFMFACAMYPGDDEFVRNVEHEAIEQVKRLRNHASLAMWCGNNEVDEGWHNWQWQQIHGIHPADSAIIWESYQRVFHELLPGVIAEHDPGRFYLHTSPVHGWGHEESMKEGPAHYWGVWWGMEPFEMYLDKVPRFMSEFGFQAMPALATIREFQPEEADTLFSNALKCHQKHPTGYETISAYLERENLHPETLLEYIYYSQLIQAKGVGMAIEAHRRDKPRCMGTLYWQFNDCWPVTSWSGMDVNGNWKALQYTVRQLYDDIMVSVIDHKGITDFYIVSGMRENIPGRVELRMIDFSNHKTVLLSRGINMRANASVLVTRIPTA
ncbi:MAG: glycoside hydrolase family 2 protein, partial [Bacteroidia bacterium]